jgi:GH25 family lysozyme M1 (1,4-beta-N-acetylmuramidase)
MTVFCHGIDLSKYQGTVDFAAVRRDGKDFAAQRWGVGNYRDPSRVSNLKAIAAAGLIPGAYFVPGENTGSGTQQARQFVEEVRSFFPAGPMLFTLDAEHSDSWGDPTARQCAEFCAEVRRLTGRMVLGYVPRWWMQAQGWTADQVADVARNALWWQSQYRENADLSSPPVTSFLGWPLKLWQYSSSGRVSGVAGEVDLDVFYGTRDELLALAGGKGAVTPTDVSEEDDEMKIARCVGRPTLLIGGPAGVQTLDADSKAALLKMGVRETVVTDDEWVALHDLAEALTKRLNDAPDAVITLHEAVDDSALRRLVRSELAKAAPPAPQA